MFPRLTAAHRYMLPGAISLLLGFALGWLAFVREGVPFSAAPGYLGLSSTKTTQLAAPYESAPKAGNGKPGSASALGQTGGGTKPSWRAPTIIPGYDPQTSFGELLAEIREAGVFTGQDLTVHLELMRDFGEEGQKVIAEFLATGEDFSNKLNTPAQYHESFRHTLIQSMGHTRSRTSEDALSRISRESGDLFEVAEAMGSLRCWGLEKAAPLDPARLTKLAADALERNPGRSHIRTQILTDVTFLSATFTNEPVPDYVWTELKTASNAGNWATWFAMWPGEVQDRVLGQVVDDPQKLKYTLKSGNMRWWDLGYPNVQKAALQLVPEMSLSDRNNFLENLRPDDVFRDRYSPGGRAKSSSPRSFLSEAERAAFQTRLRGLTSILEKIGERPGLNPTERQLVEAKLTATREALRDSADWKIWRAEE